MIQEMHRQPGKRGPRHSPATLILRLLAPKGSVSLIATILISLSSGPAVGQTLAQVISPVPGTRFPATTITFTWSPGTGAVAYELWLGSKSATNDLFRANLAGTSVTATNLPSNGSPVYARLFSKINGAWQYVDYSYLTLGPAAAEIISPTPGVQFTTGPVLFNWSPGTSTSGYTFCIGTVSGQCDVFQSSGTGLSATVTSLPTNGATLYVTLTSAFGSKSENVYYTYIASGTPQISALVVPDHGTGVSRIFRFVYDWKAGSASFRFIDLRIGTSADDTTTCALTYDTVTGSLGFSGESSTETLGSQQPITNGSCLVFLQTSTASKTATQLLLALEFQFASKGSKYTLFTREWSGTSPTAPPQSATAWQQVGTWKVGDETWPVVDKSKYATASEIARQAYVSSGYDYHYWLAKFAPLGTYFNAQNDYQSMLRLPLNDLGYPIPNGPNYNIVTLSEFALCRWSRYVIGVESPIYFLGVADTLVNLTQPDGALLYLFPAAGQQPPWTSGMAQGLTLNVFARAYSLTHDTKYLYAGKLILDFMVKVKESSGDRSDLGDINPSLDGYITNEEAPVSPYATHILNGWEFGILGLYNWYQITGDLKAKAYFDSHVETLLNALSYWDLGAWTNYDLNYLIQGNQDLDPAFTAYQALHIALQDTLGQITGDPRFYAYRDRWINQITAPQVDVILPMAVSVNPNYGAGGSGTFQYLFQSPAGLSQMGRVSGILNTTAVFAAGCGFSYDHVTNIIVLQGTGSSVSGLAGSSGTLAVPECTLDLANTTVTTTASDLLLTLPLTFSSNLSGRKFFFLAALNAANNSASSYQYANFGTWTVCSSSCPPANLLSSTRALALGTIGIGSSASLSFSVQNSQPTIATLGPIEVTGAGFTQTNTCSAVLQAGQQCTVTVTFSPAIKGPASGAVTIPHNLGAGNLVVSISGTGAPAALTASPSPLIFGYSAVGQSTVKPIMVTNYTTSGLTISAIEISGEPFAESNDCIGQLLAPAGICTVVVRVVPLGQSDIGGSIAIVSSGANTITVPLAVMGVELGLPQAATPAFSLSPGTYTSAQTVTISDSMAGSVINYTTDETQPTTTSNPYSGPITVSSSETLRAIATAGGHSPSAVASATYLITPPTFTVNGIHVTVARGAATGNTSMISVTPVAGFTGQVALSAVVTSGPNNAVDPPTLSFGTTTPVNISKSNAETATLTISTTAAKSAALVRPMRPGSRWLAAGTTISLCLLLFGFAGDRKRWRNLFGIASFLVITAGFAACGAGGGGGGLGNAGTTPGNYTITVTGSSGSLTQTTTLSLTVN